MSEKSEVWKEVGLNVWRLRTQHGMPLDDLAAALDVSRTKAYEIERGNADLGTDGLVSVCELFDVDASEILPKREKKDPEKQDQTDFESLFARLPPPVQREWKNLLIVTDREFNRPGKSGI